MQFFEILTITLGLLNGVVATMLPDFSDPRRPIGAVLSFSVLFALLIFFLPVIVLSPRFLVTSVLTVVAAVIGYASMRSLRSATNVPTERTAEIKPADRIATV